MKPNNKIVAQWLAWSVRFAALQVREKAMVIGAALFTILFGGYFLWIEPAQQERDRLTKSIETQREEQAKLSAQLASLAVTNADPDAPNRAVIEKAQRDMEILNEDLRSYDRLLVPPHAAPALLQMLLAQHHGLSLVGFSTLPPQAMVSSPSTPITTSATVATAAAAVADAVVGVIGAEAAETAPAAVSGNLYKHGIEIRVRGRFHDLVDYLTELEGSQQKLLWGSMSLTSTYPESELTLILYTLSLESIWLAV